MFSIILFAASELTLIVTGFLWLMWPSRLGHDQYSQAKLKLELWPGQWVMDDFMNSQVY